MTDLFSEEVVPDLPATREEAVARFLAAQWGCIDAQGWGYCCEREKDEWRAEAVAILEIADSWGRA